MLPGIVGAIMLAGGSFWIANIVNITNWPDLIFGFGILSLAYLALAYYVFLTPKDRELVYSFLPHKARLF